MLGFPIHPKAYEDLLVYMGNMTREKAKEVVDKLYLEQYGISREERAKQLEEEWKNLKWETVPYDANR